MKFTENCLRELDRLRRELDTAEAIVVGAGAGLSTSAGLTYSGERFMAHFADFHARYGITDIYSGGFYPFETLEEYWAWWSRHIHYNRYVEAPGSVYRDLLALLSGKNYFVLTTNVDHQFQRAGFDKRRLFYTQGDYGLFQCSKPCHDATYDNEAIVAQMLARQSDMRIPMALIPHCPKCGRPMTMNLRSDSTFVEDAGWHEAAGRYERFLKEHAGRHVLFLELGVGGNSPGVIKYPFWRMTWRNLQSVYACVNLGEVIVPEEIAERTIALDADIAQVVSALL